MILCILRILCLVWTVMGEDAYAVELMMVVVKGHDNVSHNVHAFEHVQANDEDYGSSEVTI